MGAKPYSSSTNFACTHLGEHDDPHHLRSFASLFDLNRQVIELLVNVAAEHRSERIWESWRTLGNELARLDPTQRDEFAHCPFSLVDAGLREVRAWSRADHIQPAQGELPFAPILLQNRLDHLAHATWLLAWHLVRSDMIAARLVFALNPASISLMTQATLTDIRRIAQEQVRDGRVRPRWHDRPDIWSRLIHTARSSHSDAFESVTTRGLQLFLQEFVAEERDG